MGASYTMTCPPQHETLVGQWHGPPEPTRGELPGTRPGILLKEIPISTRWSAAPAFVYHTFPSLCTSRHWDGSPAHLNNVLQRLQCLQRFPASKPRYVQPNHQQWVL